MSLDRKHPQRGCGWHPVGQFWDSILNCFILFKLHNNCLGPGSLFLRMLFFPRSWARTNHSRVAFFMFSRDRILEFLQSLFLNHKMAVFCILLLELGRSLFFVGAGFIPALNNVFRDNIVALTQVRGFTDASRQQYSFILSQSSVAALGQGGDKPRPYEKHTIRVRILLPN